MSTPQSSDSSIENHPDLQGDRHVELANLEASTYRSIVPEKLNNQPSKTKTTNEGKKKEFKVHSLSH